MGTVDVLEYSAAALRLVSHFPGTSRVPQSPGGSPVMPTPPFTTVHGCPSCPIPALQGPNPEGLGGKEYLQAAYLEGPWPEASHTQAQGHFAAELLQWEGCERRCPGHQDPMVLPFSSFLSSPSLILSSPLPTPSTAPPPHCLNDPLVSVSSQGEEDSSPQTVRCRGVTVLHMKHMHLIVNVDLAFSMRSSHAVRPGHQTRV